MNPRLSLTIVFALTLSIIGCVEDLAPLEQEVETDGDNPFLDDYSNDGKDDTAYINPDGVEVEVSIEANVAAPSYRIFDAPAELGQYAVTYLRKRGHFYLESLAEDATSDQRVEWLVDGTWITAADARQVATEKLTHFRIQGINAILLHGVADGVSEGQVFTATVPINPYTAFSDAGENCVDPDSHMTLSSSIYWYLWNPDKSACELETQEMTVTVTELLPPRRTTYPEYDRLVEDNRVTSVVLFGRIGDPPLTDSDSGVRNMNTMANWLLGADFTEVTPAPVGRRFSKTVNGVTVEVDLYSPYDFAGLSDYSNLENFERAVEEHEIVVYDGHSMLGSSDFWSRPDYPDFYQIFIYGGCLGYEYYVRPILEGKNGWDNVDIISSTIEVWASANYYFAPFLAKVLWALENDYNASWTDLLEVIRNRVGDSSFGVSGARDNCFSPGGSLCDGGGEPNPNSTRIEWTGPTQIPDNDPAGVSLTVDVAEAITFTSLSLELDITHPWVGDLEVTLTHADQSVVLWARSGGSNDDIRETFELTGFAGVDPVGSWVLSVVDHANRDVGTVNDFALIFAQ